MTVIAYKGGILAADRLATSGDIIETVPSKLFMFREKDGSLLMGAMCGTTKYTNKIKQHLHQHGMDHQIPLKIECYDADNIYGLLVNAYGALWLIYGDGTCALQESETPFMALGSGYEFAWGALAAGASAVEACQLAGLHLASCGGGTTWVNVREALLNKGELCSESPL